MYITPAIRMAGIIAKTTRARSQPLIKPITNPEISIPIVIKKVAIF